MPLNVFAGATAPDVRNLDANFAFLAGILRFREDTPTIHAAIGNAAVTENRFLVVHKESNGGQNVVNGMQIQHRFDNDSGPDFAGTRGALRVINIVGNDGGAARTLGTTWAVTAIADLKDNITTGESAVALSGTVFKRGAYQHGIAGHLQIRDYVVPGAIDTSPSVCCEMNMSVVGPDSTTAGGGFGNRHILALYAYTNLEVAGSTTNRAEVGSAIRIQPAQTEYTQDGGGNFRNGIVIRDSWHTGATYKVKDAGLRIDTGGKYGIQMRSRSSIAEILLEDGSDDYGRSEAGLVFNGTYNTGNAIRMKAGQCIALDETGAIKVRFNAATNTIQFLNGSVVKQSFSVA